MGEALGFLDPYKDVLVSTACLFRPWVKPVAAWLQHYHFPVSTACLFRPWVKLLGITNPQYPDQFQQPVFFGRG